MNNILNNLAIGAADTWKLAVDLISSSTTYVRPSDEICRVEDAKSYARPVETTEICFSCILDRLKVKHYLEINNPDDAKLFWDVVKGLNLNSDVNITPSGSIYPKSYGPSDSYLYGECVSLVRAIGNLNVSTPYWHADTNMKLSSNLGNIKPGTPIATFDWDASKDRLAYPQKEQHTMIFIEAATLGQRQGFLALDQQNDMPARIRFYDSASPSFDRYYAIDREASTQAQNRK